MLKNSSLRLSGKYSLIVLLFFAFFQFSFVSFKSAENAGMLTLQEEFFKATLPFSYNPLEDLATSEVNFSALKAVALYDEMSLEEIGLDFEAFQVAIQGMEKILRSGMAAKENILTIADFSQPSTQKRLYVIDLKEKQLLFNTFVAHGKNSGKALANSFSNTTSSFQSSLGFYKTAGTYSGKHGYSLRLEGLEQGINSNALSRAIVIHAADYVSESTIRSLGYLGRSLGCPALPKALNKPIIDKIKDGSTMFIYHPSKEYKRKSRLIS